MVTPPPNSVDTCSGASALAPTDFADEFEKCYQRLWGLAAAMLGDRADAEDVVQEAALVALRRLDQFQPGTNFVAWMAKIVRLQAFNWSRKRTGRRTDPVDPADLDRAHVSPETPRTERPTTLRVVKQLDEHQTDFDDAVTAALQSLSTDARACVLLRAVHQLSYREISEMMDIAEGTAMSHVHRGKKLLRQRLVENIKDPESNQALPQ